MGSAIFFYVDQQWRDNEKNLAERIGCILGGSEAIVERKQDQGDGDWHLDARTNDFWLHRRECVRGAAIGLQNSGWQDAPFTRYAIQSRYASHDKMQALRTVIIWLLGIERYNTATSVEGLYIGPKV